MALENGSGTAKVPEANTRTTGAYKDYLLGLDNVRKTVSQIETEMVKSIIEFYHASENSEEEFNEYLCKVNTHLIECNEELVKEHDEPVKVDSQIQIASLINRIKVSRANIPQETIHFLTGFWENIKLTVESFQIIADKFDKTVQDRLHSSCISDTWILRGEQNGYSKSTSTIADLYRNEIVQYRKNIDDGITNLRLLAASSGSCMNPQLFIKSALIDRLLKSCDYSQFPLLQLVPQLTSMLEKLLSAAKCWMDRDETYLFDIGMEIRQTKDRTKVKEAEMLKEKERQRVLMKSVRAAFLMCQNSKKKIRDIADKLHALEEQVLQSNREESEKMREKRQKESIREFLVLSISQTRRNYNLQLKRQKLNRQVKELEENLGVIKSHIAGLKTEISETVIEKQQVSEKHSKDEVYYGEMRSELEGFLKNVTQIHIELTSLRGSIAHLESIQTVKISPERIDNFFDPPSAQNVKLSPSLKEKILQKRKLKLSAPK